MAVLLSTVSIHQVAKAVTAAPAKAADIVARQAKVEDIAEVKRKAAAEVNAEQEEAKASYRSSATTIFFRTLHK